MDPKLFRVSSKNVVGQKTMATSKQTMSATRMMASSKQYRSATKMALPEQQAAISTTSKMPVAPPSKHLSMAIKMALPEQTGSSETMMMAVATKIYHEPSRKMYFSVLSALLSAVIVGMVLGWSLSALPGMVNNPEPNFPTLSHDQRRWLASVIMLAAIIGSLASASMNRFIGHRLTLLAISIPFIKGWIIIGLAKSFALMIIGRIITGVCSGFATATTPLYIYEIVTPETRGFYGSCFQLMITCGIVLSTFISYTLSWKNIPWYAVSVALIYGFGMIFASETPRRIMEHGDVYGAFLQLKLLRSSRSDCTKEMNELFERVRKMGKYSGKNFWFLLKRWDVYTPLMISGTLFFLSQFSGINSILFYLHTIFAQSGALVGPVWPPIVVYVLVVFSTLTASLLIDRYGRKFFLLSSATGMSISMFILVIYYGFKIFGAKFLPIFCLILMVISFSIGFGPIRWMIIPEITPMEALELISSISVAIYWLSAFMVVHIFEFSQSIIQNAGVYAFFTIICIGGIVFIWKMVPETKNRTLSEIQGKFYRFF